MFFDNWFGLLRVLVVGTLAYGGLILMLRVSGKRALSKMNAFDLIVTVALGSTLATVLLTGDVALLEGLLALGLLISLHLAIGWYSVCSERVQELVKAQLRLLVHRGRLLPAALRAERLTTEEISAALRAEGTGAVEEVGALGLKTDGTFSVLQRIDRGTTLHHIMGASQPPAHPAHG
jgi:uncharacterized membrane protein YcaP (DUF421 family)